MAGAGGRTAAQMPMLQALRYIVQREGIKALWKVRGGRILLQCVHVRTEALACRSPSICTGSPWCTNCMAAVCCSH